MNTLYMITNKLSGTVYFGITNNFKLRISCHKNAAKRGVKSPIYCAVRAYGWDNFEFSILNEFENRKDCEQAEIDIISSYKGKTYNLHPGGMGGFSILSKSEEDIEDWRNKLRAARVGRTPALGMHHTKEIKQICKEASDKYWETQEKYSFEVLNYRFIEATKKFGISKTHYYRLRKRALSNEQCRTIANHQEHSLSYPELPPDVTPLTPVT